jgi:hypothetical protein
MTVVSQRGGIAWALQTRKVEDAVFSPAEDVSGSGWKKHKAILADLGLQEMADQFPLEVGSGLVSPGMYKSGVFVGGTFRVLPRLQGAIGALLLALSGDFSALGHSGTDLSGACFYVKQSEQTRVPWLALRKYTPASTGGDDMTEFMIDSKMAAATFTIPGTGPAVAEFGYVGRRPFSVDNENVEGDASLYEDITGVPMSCRGSVTLPSTVVTPARAKFTGAQITLGNGMTTPEQEMVIGSYYPDDFAVLGRSAAIRMVYKWYDRELYLKLRYGNALGAWDPNVIYGPLTIRSQATKTILADHNGYAIEFYFPKVAFMVGQPTLAPQQMLQVEVTAIMAETDDAAGSPWEIRLLNNVDYGTSPFGTPVY